MKPSGLDNLVLLGIIGSHGYGTATPQSDFDYMGVVIPPPGVYLGLNTWGSSGTMEHGEEEGDKGFVEYKYYELKKFIVMCLGMNPNAIPTLWLNPMHYEVLTPCGQLLVNNRRLFNSRLAYHTFTGYAYGQLQKMGGLFNDHEGSNLEKRDGFLRFILYADQEIAKQRGYRDQIDLKSYDSGYLNTMLALRTHTLEEIKRIKLGPVTGRMGAKRKALRDKFGMDTKFAFHTIRLMRMCCEFLRQPENGLIVYRKDVDADFLYSIREGKFTPEEIKKMADDLFAEAKYLLPKSDLPERPNESDVHNLTMDMIRMSMA